MATNFSKRVLITMSSGLLGRAVLEAFIAPNVIVCVAERSLDAMDQQPAETFQLNVQSTQHLSQCANAVILRVPVLYGPGEKLSESTVTVLFEKLLERRTGKPAVMSHYERRYPTQGEEIRGVYHWTDKDCLTK
ncbi:methionine adenosyltransferase 2 subunit beta-like [Paramacrobiotus metropolitanus]|uniref:methionine adenosyltransferase 2 subunit beta-like n=1 Tax=Paramacrobiotus metropolitanus TaxID=2943436 RepID=UPI002445B7E6|nr:methionine adenosyltransferase 2 subunit beta-like [Paramacrobiotus metropolitanus]